MLWYAALLLVIAVVGAVCGLTDWLIEPSSTALMVAVVALALAVGTFVIGVARRIEARRHH